MSSEAAVAAERAAAPVSNDGPINAPDDASIGAPNDAPNDAPIGAPNDESSDAQAAQRSAVEAILIVADEPVEPAAVARAIGSTPTATERMLNELAASYDNERRGFELRRIAGGYRIYTRPEFAAAVESFVLDGQQARLTQAALETLAVVAYRQPVSRTRVSAIRGVNVDSVMRTLVTRGLVTETGTEPSSGAMLYATTPYFLERLGLSSLGELPEVADFLPDLDTVEDVDA